MKDKLKEVRINASMLTTHINDLLSALMSDGVLTPEQIAADAIELRYKAEQRIIAPLIEIQNMALDKVAAQYGAEAIHPPSAITVCDELFAASRRAQGGRRGENEVANMVIISGVAPSYLTGDAGYDAHWHWYQRFKQGGVKALLKGGKIQ